MRQTIFILSLLAQAIGAQDSPYKQFQSYMDVPGGRILEIDFYQEQLGDRFESSGTLYYIENDRYTFDDLNQRITYNSGTITTINKATKQVIYDSTIPGDVTVFDVLSGNENAIQIGEILMEKNGFRIPFILKDWDISGTLWTVPGTGKPRHIILRTTEDSKIRIKVNSSEPVKNKGIPQLDIQGFEIIDLRE